MLVLSRKLGEKIFIGEGPNLVEVTIVSIEGNKVRVGVVADRKVPVHRGEIYEKIQESQQSPQPTRAPAMKTSPAQGKKLERASA